MSIFQILGVISIIFLMGLSAFFSSSEIAMFSIPRHKLESLDSSKSSVALKKLRSNPHRLLVTILVGNNVVNIAMSSIATILIAMYLSGGEAVFVATAIISLLVLLFGETAPKSYAVENHEYALKISRPLKIFQLVLYPVVVLFDYLTRIINKITGGRPEIESYVTKDEIEGMLEAGQKQGAIDREEKQMVERVFQFSNTIAKEVMTPRLDIVYASYASSLEDVLDICVENRVTRVPIYRDNLDHIEGVVDIKDVINAIEKDKDGIENVVKPTLHVPETKEVDDLLKDMQEKRIHLAVVIDEFGSTEGIVTIEDIVERVVGEIFEAGEEKPIIRIDEKTISVKGETNIDEVNEFLGIDLPEEGEFETIAGFVYNRIGRLVEEGEKIHYDNVVLTIQETQETRILRVKIRKETIDEEIDQEADEPDKKLDEEPNKEDSS